jgi:hypothetical protein
MSDPARVVESIIAFVMLLNFLFITKGYIIEEICA